MPGGPRILAVNPNTSQGVTAAFVAEARRVAPAGVVIDGVTGRFGARIVSNAAEDIVAGHSALDLIARHAAGYDAVILAISFDTALEAARTLLPVPVVAITDAALRAATAGGRRVGIVIFGAVSRALYARVISGYGITPVGCEAIDIASAAEYLSPQAKDAAVLAACDRLAALGAEAVVICGAAIVGTASRLQGQARVPLFDGAAAVGACLAALERAEPVPEAPTPLGPTVGLSPELAALLAGTWGGPR